jgi:hypothetical protein
LLSRSPHNFILTELQGNGKLSLIIKLGVRDGGWIQPMHLEGNVVKRRGFQELQGVLSKARSLQI